MGLSDKLPETLFEGYDSDICRSAKVLAMVDTDGREITHAAAGERVEVILDRTSFYGEMGGQVGDTGKLVGEATELVVTDTKHHEGGLVAHIANVVSGELEVGDTVDTVVDHDRRELIRRNHTATHLLDAALKEVLGDHVSQAGSLVAPDRLRFDFTHFEAMTPDELGRVEDMVNAEIFAAEPMVTRVMGIEEAKASGAVALFGEKYGDVVRVVSTGKGEKPFSRELCGGTHARNTAELGLFKIVSEGSVGSNARRLEAVTSVGAIEYVDERLQQLDRVAAVLKSRPIDVLARVESLERELRDAKRQLSEATLGASAGQLSSLAEAAVQLEGYRCVFLRLEGPTGKELRGVWDSIRDSMGGGAVACVVASTTPDGRVALLAAGTAAAVDAGFHAGNIIKKLAGTVGGRGGGKAGMAQAGGSDPTGIDRALAQAKSLLAA